jgi:putative endonuclease
MTTSRQALGRWGEERAARYLTDLGYNLLARNLRTPYGEIDLIAWRDGITVFVEVKTRTSTTFGMPEDAVTLRKQAHLRASVEFYLQDHPDFEGDWRIDVIAIQRLRRGQLESILHFENALA